MNHASTIRRATLLALLATTSALLAAEPGDGGVTPAIQGVVAAGTKINVLKEGLEAVEGPVPTRDNEVLFTNNRTSQILKIGKDGVISEWMAGTGGANALTWTREGELAVTQVGDLAIAVLKPGAPARVIAKEFEGKPLNRPNDLVASRLGNIYFSDPATPGGVAPATSAVYELTAQGKLMQVATDIARPNGVALSPDERRLYVANTSGEWVVVFELDAKGNATAHRDFAHLATPPPQNGQPPASGADGMAIDADGRLFVATALGVQVFSDKGEPLGTIALPKQPQNLAFSGPGRSILYVVGRGSVFSIGTRTHGPKRAGK